MNPERALQIRSLTMQEGYFAKIELYSNTLKLIIKIFALLMVTSATITYINNIIVKKIK